MIREDNTNLSNTGNQAPSREVDQIAKREAKAIAQHMSGPAIVVAGPGTGKTKRLAQRIASLCQEHKCDPSRIVALTYTNTAAKKMIDELRPRFGETEAAKLRVSTLHYLAKGLLHKYSKRLGLSASFRVVDKLREKLLLIDARLELKEQNLKISRRERKYLYRFQALKAGVRDVDAICRLPSEERFATQQQFDEHYGSLLTYYGSVDWYDVVALAVRLFREDPDILSEVAGEIDHLLVDEYQDLNPADHELIRLLASETTSLMVFADDDQSVYETRRFANPSGVKKFKDTYPGAKKYPLSVCWRCGSSIMDAAWSLVDVNDERMPERMPKKKPISDPERGLGQFEIRKRWSEKEEIETILSELKEELSGEQPPQEILVLFHSREIGHKYFEKMGGSNLNFRNLLRLPQTTCESLLLLHETLRLLRDESDNLAARFLLEHLFERKPAWIAGRRRVSRERGISLWESVTRNSSCSPSILSWSERLKQCCEMENTVEILNEVAALLGFENDPDVTKVIEWSNQQESITIRKVIDRLERGFRFEAEEPEELGETEGPVVTFMTMHGAKGIDADVVFVPAIEDDLMPNQWYKPEQRRLLYVSMTRAKKRLLITWAWSRKGRHTYRGPERAVTDRERSTFLDDIENPKRVS